MEKEKQELMMRLYQFEEKTKKEQRGQPGASPSSSLGMGRKTFLDGLKMRSRTKSGDNLTERSEAEYNGELSPARRQSDSSRQVNH